MAYKHDDKSSGQLIRSADWNLMGHEIERLETDKLNRAGDTIKGDLTVTGKAQLGSLAVTDNASIAGVLTVSGTSSSISGKLGIGTTSPTAQLSLGEWNSGNAGFSGDQATQLLLSGAHNQGANNGRQGQITYKLKIEGYDNDGSTVYPIYCRDENELVDFWIKNRPSEGGLPTLYSAGNVGIGTTTPQAKLEVSGAGATNAELLRVANSSTDYLSIQFAAAGAGHLQLISWNNGWNINTKTAGKHLYLNRDATETSNVYIGRAANDICVKGNGNVGISVDPTEKLHVVGNAIVTGNTRAGSLNVSGATNLAGVTANGNLTVNGTGNSSIAGNLGIGTTAPTAKLHVSIGYGGTAAAAAQFQTENCGAPCGQPAWTEAIRLWNANGNGRVGLGLVNGGNGDLANVPTVYLGTFDGKDNTAFRIATKDKNNELTDRMVIEGANMAVSGAIRAVSFVNTSDKRMKTDIQELHYGLNEILRLRPVSFNWKDIPNLHKSFGLVAQEVQPHIREVVYEEKDGTLGSCFSIAYINLIPILINAIKELTNRLGELEKNLAADSIPSIGMG